MSSNASSSLNASTGHNGGLGGGSGRGWGQKLVFPRVEFDDPFADSQAVGAKGSPLGAEGSRSAGREVGRKRLSSGFGCFEAYGNGEYSRRELEVSGREANETLTSAMIDISQTTVVEHKVGDPFADPGTQEQGLGDPFECGEGEEVQMSSCLAAPVEDHRKSFISFDSSDESWVFPTQVSRFAC